jgi:hypothetical protein
MLKTFSGFFYAPTPNGGVPSPRLPTDDSSSIVSINSGDEDVDFVDKNEKTSKEGEISHVYLVIVDGVPHSVFQHETSAQQKMKEIAEKFSIRENMLPPFPCNTYQELDGNVLRLYCRYDYFTSCDRLVHRIEYKSMNLEK